MLSPATRMQGCQSKGPPFPSAQPDNEVGAVAGQAIPDGINGPDQIGVKSSPAMR